MIDSTILAQVDDLQLRYTMALDERDMSGWAACFGEVASYVCTSRENEEQQLPLAIMMDDSAERIKDRVNAVTKVWAGTFEDYTTRHFIQRTRCQPKGDGVYAVESNFMVAYTSARGQSELLAAGVYRDEIELGHGEARFRAKKAVLDTVVTPRYLVYPV